MPFSRSLPFLRSSGAAALLGVVAGCAAPPPSTPTPASVPAPLAAAPATVVPPLPREARAQPEAPSGFNDWVRDLRAQARSAGIGEVALKDAFDDVRYLPRVIELDRAQPEFTRTVWDYLETAVSPQRVALGEQKLAQVRAQADAAAARYGVPATVVVAIWGMESNYGSNYGNIPTIDALATLGFEGRRQSWARDQLMAALKIIDSGDIRHAQMIGSWAGAMGQTQFLPTSFLAYAVDADGDGRRDIWGSMADVMASTANYLARSGWQPAQPWGAEVQLPSGFDHARADRAVRQTSAQWAADGVQGVGGAALPALTDASILLPAGARGPAFLIGPNFRAILRYNNSDSYALGVGLLAQRLAGEPGVVAAWPRDQQALSRAQVLALQTSLNQRGFDAGVADGMMGPSTRDGLRNYQRSLGLPADGYPTLELLERLRAP